MMKMIVISAILSVTVVACVSLLVTIKKENTRLKERADQVNSRYLNISSWSKEKGSFTFLSFDGGFNWYEVERPIHEVRVIGPADPKILGEIFGMKALVEHARNNGPIGSRPIVPEDISALNAAGFEVNISSP